MTPEQKASIDDFRTRWPLDRLKVMTLEEYTSVGSKDSFTFWLESRTDKVGSIWGGSSFKFGIFERKNLDGTPKADRTHSFNERYGWYTYLGSTPDEVFTKVKAILVTVVDAVGRKDLRTIGEQEFSPAIQWKVAFLYQDFTSPCVLPIYQIDALRYLATGSSNSKATAAECQTKLVRGFPAGMDPVERMYELWNQWERTQENVAGLIASDRNPEWKDSVIEALKTKDHAVVWWSKKPSGGAPVFQQLNTLLESAESFPFYYASGGKVRYRCRVVAMATADDYDDLSSLWTAADGYQEQFENYEDGKQRARIAFLVDTFEKIDLPHSTSDFTFWNGQSIPTQDNLQAFVSIIPRSQEEVTPMTEPLPSKNIIYYGPPGTGKTWFLQNILFPRFTVEGAGKPRDKWLVEQTDAMSWWKVIVAVLVNLGPSTVSSIINHEFLQAKIKTTKQANPRAMVWAMLQQHTLLDCELVKYTKRTEPLLFRKNSDSVWEVERQNLSELVPEVLGFLDETKNYKAQGAVKEQNYEFLTFHQSMSYEDFIEGIKPSLDEEDDSNLDYQLKDGIFKILCQKARNNPDRDHALFIDEINRGNIPAIFGELISLIEDDKREGEKNQLTAKLPYSKRLFSVPPNLYLIGTMNTADRSVESLDAALRRRFSFVAQMPDPSLLTKNCAGVDVQELLAKINQRLERLLDLDHTIGHAFLWELTGLEDLQSRFQNKIIPQLQEYFYGDWRKIGLVLGDRFVERVKLPATGQKFWPPGFPDEDSEAKTEVYRIKPTSDWMVEAFQSIYVAPTQ